MLVANLFALLCLIVFVCFFPFLLKPRSFVWRVPFIVVILHNLWRSLGLGLTMAHECSLTALQSHCINDHCYEMAINYHCYEMAIDSVL